jgi:hypothetical protein
MTGTGGIPRIDLRVPRYPRHDRPPLDRVPESSPDGGGSAKVTFVRQGDPIPSPKVTFVDSGQFVGHVVLVAPLDSSLATAGEAATAPRQVDPPAAKLRECPHGPLRILGDDGGSGSSHDSDSHPSQAAFAGDLAALAGPAGLDPLVVVADHEPAASGAASEHAAHEVGHGSGSIHRYIIAYAHLDY